MLGWLVAWTGFSFILIAFWVGGCEIYRGVGKSSKT